MSHRQLKPAGVSGIFGKIDIIIAKNYSTGRQNKDTAFDSQKRFFAQLITKWIIDIIQQIGGKT